MESFGRFSPDLNDLDLKVDLLIWELMGANSMGFENVGEFGSSHHFEMPFADHIILNTY